MQIFSPIRPLVLKLFITNYWAKIEGSGPLRRERMYIKESLTEVFSETMHRTVTNDGILDSSTHGMVDGPIQILI